MTHKGHPDPDSSLTAEAADWYARVRSGNLPEIEAARFRAWIAGHPDHRQEFEELDALWEELHAIEQSPEVVREKLSFTPRSAGSRKTPARDPLSGARHRPKSLPWAVAAALLAAIGIFT